MKVTLLMAQCTSELLKQSIQIVRKVLKELDVEIYTVELHKLPYFEGNKTKQIENIMASIESSQGVVAVSAVPMLGMHGAMQSFFDNATMYPAEYFNKPLMAITYSEWLGEQEAAQIMQKCWSILGGTEGGSIYMNKALPSTSALERLEKEVENFYRFMKQERPNIGCSERIFYYRVKQGDEGNKYGDPAHIEKKPEIRNFSDIVREDQFASRMAYYKQENEGNMPVESKKVVSNSPVKPADTHIDLSTKEQTIKEIAHFIEKEANGDGFRSMNSGVYTRPPQVLSTNISVRKLQQIPHYFAAQYDKSLNMVLRYQLTDIDEKGYIVIRDGDCTFEEEVASTPTVEMILTEEVLQSILSKKITYQKAFMLGKLKVKGNFSILPKLDQIFRAL